jgi:outer membrane murein-binding lipoprotein Lpp
VLFLAGALVGGGIVLLTIRRSTGGRNGNDVHGLASRVERSRRDREELRADLAAALVDESRASERMSLLMTLGRLQDPGAAPLLLERLSLRPGRGEPPNLSVAGLSALGWSAVPHLMTWLRSGPHPQSELRHVAKMLRESMGTDVARGHLVAERVVSFDDERVFIDQVMQIIDEQDERENSDK